MTSRDEEDEVEYQFDGLEKRGTSPLKSDGAYATQNQPQFVARGTINGGFKKPNGVMADSHQTDTSNEGELSNDDTYSKNLQSDDDGVSNRLQSEMRHNVGMGIVNNVIGASN